MNDLAIEFNCNFAKKNTQFILKGWNDLVRKHVPCGRDFTEVFGFHRMTSSELSERGKQVELGDKMSIMRNRESIEKLVPHSLLDEVSSASGEIHRSFASMRSPSEEVFSGYT